MANTTANYSGLLSQIVEAQLSTRRLNDITISDKVYTIGFYKVTKNDVTDELPCLKDAKGHEYSLSVSQMAALRVATGDVTRIEWADEWRNAESGAIFQEIAKQMVADGKSLENVSFKCTHALKVKNHLVGGNVPVYKDFCYNGSLVYTQGVRTLLKDKDRSFYKTPEYRTGIQALRETLNLSGLVVDKAIEANLLILPVFVVL